MPGRAVFALPAARAALGAAAVALALGGLAANRAIHESADARYADADAVWTMELAHGIEAFPPLAYSYRQQLFGLLGVHWASERARFPARAKGLLDWADREAAAASAAEPWNWRIENELARLYAEVARTDPEYGEKARSHLARARELAPNRAVFRLRLARPEALGMERRADGTVVLRWRPAPGAGYHAIQGSADGRLWTPVRYAWDAARPELVTGACAQCRYRIRACRYHRDCSGWARWE